MRGSARPAAAKAGVWLLIVVPTAEEAAEKAAHIVGLLPANNLTGPAIFEFEAAHRCPDFAGCDAPEKAAAALIDKDSAVEMYSGLRQERLHCVCYHRAATLWALWQLGPSSLCHNCVAKASRFVRLCDAFSVPVLTIVNTNGFVPSTTDDIAGGIREAARLAGTYADATTAKVGRAGWARPWALSTLPWPMPTCELAVTGCTVSAPWSPTAAARCAV